MMMVFMTTSITCFADAEKKSSFKERIQSIQQDDGRQHLKFAFYLDSEGHANFEQKVLDEVVNSIQAKVPSYVTVQGDGQFLADLDLLLTLNSANSKIPPCGYRISTTLSPFL